MKAGEGGITIRADTAMRALRMTLRADRIDVEVKGQIGGWVHERSIGLEEISHVWRYRARTPLHLFWLVFGIPLLVGGGSLATTQFGPGAVLAGAGAFVCGVAAWLGLRSRVFVRLVTRAGDWLDIAEASGVFGAARRRAFFVELFGALGVEHPASLA